MSTGHPRLLVLTPDYPPAAGGIQHVAERVVEHLDGGFEVRVVTLGSADGPEAGPGGAAVRRVPEWGSRRAGNVLLNLRGIGEAVAFGPRIVLSVHIATSPAAALVQRHLGAPFVQYLHADEVTARPALARFAVCRATACIAVSRHTAALACAAGAAPRRVHIVPPGVDLPAATTSEPKDPRPTIVTVARLVDRYKGHDVMLRALPAVIERVPEVQWVVVGDGPLGPELRTTAEELGLGAHVRFVGTVEDRERDRRLGRAHVFAMPSRLSPEGGGEGFGIVYMEAAAHGLPAVAGNVGGATDAIVDGRTGVLVDPSNPAAVAAALADLLEDPERVRAMGAAGRERAAEFTWPSIGERLDELLREVLAAQAR